MSGVLVVAAHPDDAELAVGGTLALLGDRGTEATVAVVAVSEADEEHRRLRVRAAERAASILGHRLRWLAREPLDQVEDIPEYEVVRLVDDLVAQVRPDAVLTHWEGDSHGDHVRVARAVVSSSRRWPEVSLCQFGPNEHRTTRFLEFVPNVFVPIADQLPRKLDALRSFSYPGQGFRPLDEEWARQQALLNGRHVGVPAAESLRLLRCRTDGPGPLGIPTAPLPMDDHHVREGEEDD
ncbi:PIG-L deacetylase family protein [Streptomyces sp. H51]|uniref:PIG-L deacetylase family protein n=1 Tax=Streptomyces sp. H51 TaxID=3111770 RepID=UPI002D77700A|nr:PIG-L deacetylase family protein [Streptomyces sp. H51]